MIDLTEWVVDNLNKVKETSENFEWTAECPFCEKFGSFYINLDTDKLGPYVCFKCDSKSRTIFNLISHVLGVTYHEAKDIVYEEDYTPIRTETKKSLRERIESFRNVEQKNIQEENNISLPKEFIPVWKNGEWKIPMYMINRGFERSILRRWKIGYIQSGYYAQRLVVPITCPNGNSFVARDLTGNSEIKYLNPKSSNHSKLLYGWDQVKLESDFILAEGPLDAMKLEQHGLPALALGGKVLHPFQFKLLMMRPPDVTPTIMLDPDAYHE